MARRYADDERRPWIGTVTISPGYFDVLGVAIDARPRHRIGDGAPGAENVVDQPGDRRPLLPRRRSGWPAHSFRAARRRAERAAAAVANHRRRRARRSCRATTDEAFRSPVVYLPFRQVAPRPTSSLLVRSTPAARQAS